jgi:uncharacterized protein (DUF885 family)
MIQAIVRNVSLILAASLVAAVPSPAPPSGANETYAALAQSYYTENFRLNPIVATGVGVHDYDDQIGDFSVAGIMAQLASDREYLAKLQAIDELLSRGDPPIALLRPFILGSSDDGKPL